MHGDWSCQYVSGCLWQADGAGGGGQMTWVGEESDPDCLPCTTVSGTFDAIRVQVIAGPAAAGLISVIVLGNILRFTAKIEGRKPARCRLGIVD